MNNRKTAAALAAVMLLSGCTLASGADNSGSGAENSVSLAPVQTQEVSSAADDEQIETAVGTDRGGVTGNPGEDQPAPQIIPIETVKPLICDTLPDLGAEMSDEEKSNYDMYKPVADDIIAKLVAKDSAGLSESMGELSGHGFDFISGIDFTGTEIKEDTVDDFTYYAKVKLMVNGGDSAVFPRGESEWILTVAYGADAPIGYFGPAETYYNSNVTRDNIYEFCYNTSHRLGVFDTITDMSQLGTRDNLTDPEFYFGLTIALLYAGNEGSVPESREELLSRSVLLDGAKRVYNLSGLDPSVCGAFYDSTTEMMSIPAKGGTWRFWRPVKHDTDNGIHTVTIDYYADEGYLLKAKTMVYTVEEDAEGRYRMVSVEKTYENSSLELAMGSV